MRPVQSASVDSTRYLGHGSAEVAQETTIENGKLRKRGIDVWHGEGRLANGCGYHPKYSLQTLGFSSLVS